MKPVLDGDPETAPITPWTVFLAFLQLGLTSFGGPVAHIGYFRTAFVVRRRWLSEAAYADLVALCQALPGPASSQVGMGIGLSKAGLHGALAAWVGFTLPSALLMTAFAFVVTEDQDLIPAGVLHGLKTATVAVVAQAVWAMSRDLCPDWPRRFLAAGASIAALAIPGAFAQIGILLTAAGLGQLVLRSSEPSRTQALGHTLTRSHSVLAFSLFGLLLGGLPIAAHLWPEHWVLLIDRFFRAGSLVFGGGHVVLPLLYEAVVPTGWVSNDAFLAGYGAAQAVPGPLFTFAAFLGAASGPVPLGLPGAALALGAIFLPSLLLVAGAMPLWDQARRSASLRGALQGVNAAVVGLLLAALITPVGTSGLTRPTDAALAMGAFLALAFGRAPAWIVVLACAAAGWGLNV